MDLSEIAALEVALQNSLTAGHTQGGRTMCKEEQAIPETLTCTLWMVLLTEPRKTREEGLGRGSWKLISDLLTSRRLLDLQVDTSGSSGDRVRPEMQI